MSWRKRGFVWKALLIGGSGRKLSCSPTGAQAEVQVSVPPLVEVMRGDPVTLDCTPLGLRDHFMLEWFLVSASGLGPEGGRGGSERTQRVCKYSFFHQNPQDPKSSAKLPFHFIDGEIEAK